MNIEQFKKEFDAKLAAMTTEELIADLKECGFKFYDNDVWDIAKQYPIHIQFYPETTENEEYYIASSGLVYSSKGYDRTEALEKCQTAILDALQAEKNANQSISPPV